MFLLLYTLAAIANIVAKNHNFYIDNETNPYLRVKRSIDTSSIPSHSNEVPKISSSGDVKVNFKDIDESNLSKSIESVDFKRKLKLNRKIAEPNLNSDVNINYIDTKSADSNSALDIEPIEFNINKLISTRKHNVDASDIETLLRTNRDDNKENGSEQSYSNIIFSNDLDKSFVNINNDNNLDQTRIKAKTDQKNRHKRSYYIQILRPSNDYDRNENDRQVTTPRIHNTTDDEVTTVYEDTNKTSNSIDKQTSTTPLYDDYDNDGYFVKTPPKKVDYYNNNKTEKYPSTIGNNNITDNKTQAYFPLSHTYIPGYNKPDGVFKFEKGPVFTNTTRKGNEKNETNLLKSNEILRDSNVTKDESKFEENDIDMKNLKRVKSSYYLQKPNKPGTAPEYNPLSHTYIPGYYTGDDLFDFELGSVLAKPKNESHEDRNATKGDRPKTNPKNYNDKNKKNVENTAKQVPSKSKVTQTTISHSSTTKKPNTEDYDYGGDFFQSPQKKHGKIPAESRPNYKNNHTPNKQKNNNSNMDYDSLDYKNDGDFIVRAPNRNNGNHKPVNGQQPNHNNKQNGAHHYVPHPTANTKSRPSTTKKINTESNPRHTRHRITRLKRSYYMPIYENENNSRKKVKYYPLSHTYIPGYNEQGDVWHYEGGNVYPYPNNNNGYDIVSNDNQPPRRQYHRNNKPKQHDIDESTENDKHNTRNNERGKHETKVNNNKDESLLSVIISPIKKLFGYRKKRSIKFANDDNANDAIIVRKRNGVTDFFKNMVEKVYNYTIHDQTVVIDESNLYNSPDINSNTNAISSGVQSEEYSNTDQYNPYSSRYSTHNLNYADYNRNTHVSGHQDPYQSNLNQVNNIPYNNMNYFINHTFTPQNAKQENEANDDIGTERNDIGTDREVNEIDGNDDTTVTELTERILKETCIMCQSMGCPKNHKRRGFVCVPIG